VSHTHHIHPTKIKNPARLECTKPPTTQCCDVSGNITPCYEAVIAAELGLFQQGSRVLHTSAQLCASFQRATVQCLCQVTACYCNLIVSAVQCTQLALGLRLSHGAFCHGGPHHKSSPCCNRLSRSGPCDDRPHLALPLCSAVHAPLCQSGGRTAVQLLLEASKKM